MYQRDLEKEAISGAAIKEFIKKFMAGLSSRNPGVLLGQGGPTTSAAKLKLSLLKAIDSISGNLGRLSNEAAFATKNPGLYKTFKTRGIIDKEKMRLLAKQLKYQERENQNFFRELLKHREEIGKLKYGPYYREILDLPLAIRGMSNQIRPSTAAELQRLGL